MNLKNSLIKRIGPYIFPLRIRHLHGPRRLNTARQDLVVTTLARDAERFMPTFIEHHLNLGAHHIVVLDNGSRDRTVEIAKQYDRVTVLSTRASFKYHEYIMRRYLIQRFAKQRWCLYLDVDELFDYPYSDRLALPDFLAYLDHYGYTAVVGQMLDMFADRPLRPQPANHPDLRSEYPCYDLEAVEQKPYPRDDGNERASEQVTRLYGGVRETFVGVTVLLSKHPLLFNDGKISPFTGRSARAHSVQGARVADISCLLRHYKLIDGFYEQAQQVAKTEHYSDNDSRDYKKYLAAMEASPQALNPTRDTAQLFSGVNTLVDQGFLHTSTAYENWVAQHTVAADSQVSNTTTPRRPD